MPASTPRLLSPTDPAPVLRENRAGAAPFLLTADHAGRAVPAALGDQGVSPAERARHIGWDIGIWGVTTRLAGLLDAPAIGQAYSRLVIDCNRNPVWSGAMPVVSESTAIPGNIGLTEAAKTSRVREIFTPYHEALRDALDGRTMPFAMVAMHSFTPVYNGVARPWHFGVLFHRHSAMSLILAEMLRAEGGLVIGENEPYSVSDTSDYSVPVHAEARGLPYLELEIRQDLIADAAGQAEWAARLGRLLPIVWARYLQTT